MQANVLDAVAQVWLLCESRPASAREQSVNNKADPAQRCNRWPGP